MTIASMATMMPAAVVTSASAMPGPTTSMPAWWVAPISLNARKMPHTVPNRPTNGAVAPMVAKSHSCPLSVSATRCRSRSTAASSAPSDERPWRSKPTRKNSAASDELRSQAARASATAPR